MAQASHVKSFPEIEIIMKNKSRAELRDQRKRHIMRKIHILRRIGGEENVLAWSRGQPGRLSKGKIHCSCWMCRKKSYDIPSHSDRRKEEAMRRQERDLEVFGYGK